MVGHIIGKGRSSSIRSPLRWVGSKRRLLEFIVSRFPTFFKTYHEPFVGGGSVLLSLSSTNAIASDANAELINFWAVLVDAPDDLWSAVSLFNVDERSFYEIRSWDREPSFATIDRVRRAARFLYLNRTCFNGIWRVNPKGHNNVPWGRRSSLGLTSDDLRHVSSSLRKRDVSFVCDDFTSALRRPVSGDLVYVDPPYVPISTTESFVGYSAGGFSDADQVRLRDDVVSLASNGVRVFVSNSSAPRVRELYDGHVIHEVLIQRLVGGKGALRRPVTELLIDVQGKV